MKFLSNFNPENLKESQHLGELGVGGMILLKSILKQ
jgi:hypothetical protein